MDPAARDDELSHAKKGVGLLLVSARATNLLVVIDLTKEDLLETALRA